MKTLCSLLWGIMAKLWMGIMVEALLKRFFVCVGVICLWKSIFSSLLLYLAGWDITLCNEYEGSSCFCIICSWYKLLQTRFGMLCLQLCFLFCYEPLKSLTVRYYDNTWCNANLTPSLKTVHVVSMYNTTYDEGEVKSLGWYLYGQKENKCIWWYLNSRPVSPGADTWRAFYPKVRFWDHSLFSLPFFIRTSTKSLAI